MSRPLRSNVKMPHPGARRSRLSETLILVGSLLIFSMLLLAVKLVLASQQRLDKPPLISAGQSPSAQNWNLKAPLPSIPAEIPAPMAPSPTPATEPEQDADRLTDLYLPVIVGVEPEPTPAEEPVTVVEPTSEPVAEQTPEPASDLELRFAPSAGPVVRLVIPSIGVNRTVVPMGFKKGSGKQPTWNTDALFANGNRSDLVGQMITSVNPGDGSNIVLVGHNYNDGLYAWEGVFVNLQNVKPGDQITLFTESGAEFTYIVQNVKKVPWRKQSSAELEKHQKFLWPTEKEQLTLVTCGGEVLWTWSARIYVVATPLQTASQ